MKGTDHIDTLVYPTLLSTRVHLCQDPFPLTQDVLRRPITGYRKTMKPRAQEISLELVSWTDCIGDTTEERTSESSLLVCTGWSLNICVAHMLPKGPEAMGLRCGYWTLESPTGHTWSHLTGCQHADSRTYPGT